MPPHACRRFLGTKLWRPRRLDQERRNHFFRLNVTRTAENSAGLEFASSHRIRFINDVVIFWYALSSTLSICSTKEEWQGTLSSPHPLRQGETMRNLPLPMIHVRRHLERLFSERMWEWAKILLVVPCLRPASARSRRVCV